MLYVGWGVPEIHKSNCRTFEITVIDDCEAIVMVWIDEELEKEARGINDCKIALSLYRFDDVLL